MTDEQKRDWVEIGATVLLALAAVATAWSSYQASRWNGEQAKAASRTNGIRIEAARASDLANAEREIDVTVFEQWVDAYALGERELAAFYRKRFREEFKPAFEAWIATRPFQDPDAPLTPFRMAEYRLAATAEVDRLDAEAAESSASVQRNIQRSTNYVLGVVLFAAALFFGAMCTKFTAPNLRRATLGLGFLVFVGGIAWIATFPVSVAI